MSEKSEGISTLEVIGILVFFVSLFYLLWDRIKCRTSNMLLLAIGWFATLATEFYLFYWFYSDVLEAAKDGTPLDPGAEARFYFAFGTYILVIIIAHFTSKYEFDQERMAQTAREILDENGYWDN